MAPKSKAQIDAGIVHPNMVGPKAGGVDPKYTDYHVKAGVRQQRNQPAELHPPGSMSAKPAKPRSDAAPATSDGDGDR
jgi:hypothetical protein